MRNPTGGSLPPGLYGRATPQATDRCGAEPNLHSAAEGALHPIEQPAVPAQRALGDVEQVVLIGPLQPLLDQLARLGRVTLVERRVEAEVFRGGALFEAVVM